MGPIPIEPSDKSVPNVRHKINTMKENYAPNEQYTVEPFCKESALDCRLNSTFSWFQLFDICICHEMEIQQKTFLQM